MERFLLALACMGLVAAGAWADRVRLLDEPREAMLVRAELIANARREILVESFILGDDRLSYGFLGLLREAAARGVEVKLLGDASWNHLPRSLQAHLRESGLEIREYHVLRLDKPHWVTRRLHDKLLVVDGEVIVVGGRNVEAPYFGDGATVSRRDYVDCDLALESAEAARLLPGRLGEPPRRGHVARTLPEGPRPRGEPDRRGRGVARRTTRGVECRWERGGESLA